jgi:hypothetical protein
MIDSGAHFIMNGRAWELGIEDVKADVTDP